MASPTPASPCINICCMDPDNGLCAGCQRTLEEITGWSRFDDTTRLAVLDRVAERQRQISADKAKKT